jgi:RimJ/RimL family protein N-acetyltransferase
LAIADVSTRAIETSQGAGKAVDRVAEIRKGDPVPLIRIVHLDAVAFRALAAGDRAAAEAVSPVPLSEYLVGPEPRGVWRMRSEQCESDPGAAAWVTGIVWDEQNSFAAGAAGFHEPPDADGMVEIGYGIDPAFRRRGYARAALEALLARAAREPDVRRVRVSIRPDNVASSGLALRYGFRQIGEQWDDEDGLELVYEMGAEAGSRGPIANGSPGSAPE